MKLLLDARALQRHIDGIGRYALGMMRGLKEVRPEWTMEVLHLPEAEDNFRGLPVTLRPCSVPRFRRGEDRRVSPVIESSGAQVYLNFSMAGPCPAIPTVITVYDLMVLNLPGYFGASAMVNLAARTVFRSRLKRSISHSAAISVLSESSLRELGSTFPGSTMKAFVSGGGQDLFPAEADRCWSGTGDYLLYVGNARAYKNLTRLVIAYSRLRAMEPSFPPLTMVVRKDRAFPSFMRDLEDCSGRDSITVLSAIDDTKLRELYSGCMGVVMPSLQEGLGLPALEAMAAGAPVVCSSGTALEDLAGSACIAVDPLSVTDIMRGIATLVAHPGLREDLSRRGRVRASEFTWEAAAEKVAAALEDIS